MIEANTKIIMTYDALAEHDKQVREDAIDEVIKNIEFGIEATGHTDSYTMGFCNALIWLKSCITSEEEPQFFKTEQMSDAKYEYGCEITSTTECPLREQIRAEVIDEFVKAFLDKENQSNYIQLNQHTQSWNGYAKNIAEQLKEQNK